MSERRTKDGYSQFADKSDIPIVSLQDDIIDSFIELALRDDISFKQAVGNFIIGLAEAELTFRGLSSDSA